MCRRSGRRAGRGKLEIFFGAAPGDGKTCAMPIVVDELAHANAEGSRHAKRWQDVAELLDAGIDVHTTSNVQSVESLANIAEQTAGVCVRETVPDAMFERSEEIRIVDLSPDDPRALRSPRSPRAAPPPSTPCRSTPS